MEISRIFETITLKWTIRLLTIFTYRFVQYSDKYEYSDLRVSQVNTMNTTKAFVESLERVQDLLNIPSQENVQESSQIINTIIVNIDKKIYTGKSANEIRTIALQWETILCTMLNFVSRCKTVSIECYYAPI